VKYVRNSFEKFSFERIDSMISRFTSSFGFSRENGIGLHSYLIMRWIPKGSEVSSDKAESKGPTFVRGSNLVA